MKSPAASALTYLSESAPSAIANTNIAAPARPNDNESCWVKSLRVNRLSATAPP